MSEKTKITIEMNDSEPKTIRVSTAREMGAIATGLPESTPVRAKEGPDGELVLEGIDTGTELYRGDDEAHRPTGDDLPAQ